MQVAQVLLNDADLLLLDEPASHFGYLILLLGVTNFLKSSKTVLFIPTTVISWTMWPHVSLSWAEANLIEYQGNYQDIFV